MALLDSEGFGLSTAGQDFVDHGVILVGSGGSIPVTPGGIMGDNFMTFAAAINARRMFTAAAATWFCGFRVRPSANNGASGFSFVDGAGVSQFTVQIGVTGIATAVRGTWTGTVLGASASPGDVPPHVWSYIEIGATISTTVGTITIKVNGVTILALTGLNNQGGAVANTQGILFSPGFSSDETGVAHLYFCDATGGTPWNSYLGDVRVQTLFPTADDAVQFTPNGLANNWRNGAKVPPVPATDYNADTTVGHQDTFVMAPADGSLGVIYGVHVKPLLGKSDAGARSAASVLKSGATTDVGASTALNAAATALQLKKMYQLDPNTSAQWALADVNLIKAGYKVTA